MKKFTIYKDIKVIHKSLVDTIKDLKKQLKQVNTLPQDKIIPTMSKLMGELYNVKQEFRQRHIAYCLIRGRSIEQIEPKSRPKDRWEQHYHEQAIQKFIQEYRENINLYREAILTNE